MRHFVLLASIISVSCISTKLETRSNHPANPASHPASAQDASAALKAGFDPFEAYETDAGSSEPSKGHEHGAHIAH